MPRDDRERAKRGASEKSGHDRRALIAALEHEGLSVTEWTDDPGASYAPHAHPRQEVRVVLEGWMTILVDGHARTLGPGARIDLAPGVIHAATVGDRGVRYLAGTTREDRSPRAG